MLPMPLASAVQLILNQYDVYDVDTLLVMLRSPLDIEFRVRVWRRSRRWRCFKQSASGTIWAASSFRRRFDHGMRVTRTAGDGRKEGAKHIKT